MRACPHCGANNEDENEYCNNCGESIPQLTRHVIQQVGPLTGTEGKMQETPTAKKAADAATPPEIKKPKHRTMIGIGSVPPAPPTPEPVRLMQEGVKSKRHGTLIGMHVDVDDMPVEQPSEPRAETIEKTLKPMVIKGVEAAPPKEAVAPEMKAEGDGEAGLDVKGYFDDAEIEILVETSAPPEEEPPEEEAGPPEPEPRAPKEREAPVFERRVPTVKPRELPAARPAPGREETGKTGYFIAAFLILAAVIGGYYYYQQAGHRQGTARTPSGTEPEPAGSVTEQAAPQPEASKWRVALQGIPDNASVYVDDVLHPERPIRLQKTETPRKVRIEAPGYQTWEKSVAVESDVTLPVDMSLLSEAAQAAGEPSAAKKPPEKKAKAPPKPKPKPKKKGAYGSDYNPYE